MTIDDSIVTGACLVIDDYKVELKDGKFTTNGKGDCANSGGGLVGDQPQYKNNIKFPIGEETETYIAEVYLDPTNLATECTEETAKQNSKTGTKTGCMKWYVYKDSEPNNPSSGTYTMILDHNTTEKLVWVSSADYGNAEQKVSDVGITYSGGSVPEGTYGSYGNNNRGPLTLLDQLKTDTEGWQTDVIPSSDTYSPNNGFEWTIDYSSNGYKARLITAEEIAEITKNDRSGDNYSISSSPEEPWTLQSGSFLLDKQTADCFNDDNCDTTGTISKYWWLFDNTSGCTSYGCKTADSGTNGYWTSSPSAGISYYAWYVHYFGRLDGNYVYGGYDYGVRPVITVSKSKFLQE